MAIRLMCTLFPWPTFVGRPLGARRIYRPIGELPCGVYEHPRRVAELAETSVTKEECRDPVGCIFLERGYGVGVDVEREGYGRVTEAFTHDLGMHTCRERERGVRVPKIVEPNAAQLRGLHLSKSWLKRSGCTKRPSSRVKTRPEFS